MSLQNYNSCLNLYVDRSFSFKKRGIEQRLSICNSCTMPAAEVTFKYQPRKIRTLIILHSIRPNTKYALDIIFQIKLPCIQKTLSR